MNLLEWRKAKDLTMAEAAEVLGIPQPTISRIEAGVHLPNSATISKLITNSSGEITAADVYSAWEAAQAQKAAAQ